MRQIHKNVKLVKHVLQIFAFKIHLLSKFYTKKLKQTWDSTETN